MSSSFNGPNYRWTITSSSLNNRQLISGATQKTSNLEGPGEFASGEHRKCWEHLLQSKGCSRLPSGSSLMFFPHFHKVSHRFLSSVLSEFLPGVAFSWGNKSPQYIHLWNNEDVGARVSSLSLLLIFCLFSCSLLAYALFQDYFEQILLCQHI